MIDGQRQTTMTTERERLEPFAPVIGRPKTGDPVEPAAGRVNAERRVTGEPTAR